MRPRALPRLIASAALALAPAPTALSAQGRPYTEGTVWEVTMIRTTPGMGEDYLRGLGTTWKKMMDEAKKQGIVVSYKVLSTTASNADDWDILLMVEYRNWAAFDGISDKFEAIERKIVGTEDQSRQLMTQRLSMRRILGSKTGQELLLK